MIVAIAEATRFVHIEKLLKSYESIILDNTKEDLFALIRGWNKVKIYEGKSVGLVSTPDIARNL